MINKFILERKVEWNKEFKGILDECGLFGTQEMMDDFNTATITLLLEKLRGEIDGMKEVDKETLKEKPHEESCCNEILDAVINLLTPTTGE